MGLIWVALSFASAVVTVTDHHGHQWLIALGVFIVLWFARPKWLRWLP